MIIFYSGSCGFAAGGRNLGEPEVVLRHHCNLMLSYILIREKREEQQKRFPAIVHARKKNHAPQS